MSVTEQILYILELVGTAAYAVSGALCAIERKLDLVGVIIIGCITGVGGGLTRDILIGRIPATLFVRLEYVSVAAASALIVFVVAFIRHRRYKVLFSRVEKVNNVFDALGLSAFSVITVEASTVDATRGNAFMIICVAVINCVAGGMLRDVLTGAKPYVLCKHIYLLAALAGCLVYYYLPVFGVDKVIATFAAMTLVFLIRMLATHFRWEMPHVDLGEK